MGSFKVKIPMPPWLQQQRPRQQRRKNFWRVSRKKMEELSAKISSHQQHSKARNQVGASRWVSVDLVITRTSTRTSKPRSKRRGRKTSRTKTPTERMSKAKRRRRSKERRSRTRKKRRL